MIHCVRIPNWCAGAWTRLLLGWVGFVLLGGYFLAEWRMTKAQPLRDLTLEGKWIRASGDPSHAGYFRKRFRLTSQVKHAWIVIASQGGCEVSVNRNPMGRMYLWRPTRAFQSGSSERGQMLHPQEPTMALNFPREYQWSGHDNSQLPLYFDLTPSFQMGENVVCIETESRSIPAMVNFHGEIELWSGEKIAIRSGEDWLGESCPPGPQSLDWTETFYWDKEWNQAILCDGQKTQVQRIVPEAIFSQPFAGSWLRHPSANPTSAVSFTKKWQVEHEIDEAWMRLITNRPLEIYINDQRVSSPAANPSDQDAGEWILGKSAAIDPVANPELLDPDEVGSFFVGDAFESPRKADQKLEEFIPANPMHNMPFQYKRTTNRSEPAGVYDPARTLAESRRTPSRPDYFPELPIPNSLKRDRAVGGYFAYSIAPLVHRGSNTIEIRCVGKEDANWAPQIAVDGGYTTIKSTEIGSLSSRDWQVRCLETTQGLVDAYCEGPVAESGGKLPSLKYRGSIASKKSHSRIVAESIGIMALASLAMILTRLSLSWRHGYAGLAKLANSSDIIAGMLFIGTIGFATSMLVFVSWRERSESIWVDQGTGWSISLGLTISAMALVAVCSLAERTLSRGLRDGFRQMSKSLVELPTSRFWPHLLIWITLLCIFLRAYKLDLQPLDDDEYASTQAVLAILETGTPEFEADGVYYTRSPLFHYITAAIAYPFGGNLWSLRLQSVGWSVATVWLTYLFGARLMGSRWVGAMAMLLMTIHPLEVFTGHVIRFYQIQQFFALWTMYMFCLGFVTQQRQAYRVGTIVLFAAAVLSQEITATMAIPMLLCYLVFAKDLGWRANARLFAVACMAVAIIAVDFLAFQTLCLTRTEGVSPSVEATVKPHFWQPYNLMSVFIGYSRLHVVLSAFLLLGAPFLWKAGNRNTIALLGFLLTGVLMTNLLVTNVSLRYQYWLIPAWILLGVESIRQGVLMLSSWVFASQRQPFLYRAHLSVSTAIIAVGCIASFSPWRLVGSYELSLLGDSTGCVRFVHSQLRPGDQVAISEPHTHAGLIENGKVDFDVSIPLLYDFAVMQDGQLIDRNGGAKMFSNLDSLKSEISNRGRIWILINREKFRARGKNLRWEYPGARFELFLRKNCELKYRTYLWNAYLWDPSRGHYSHFRSQE